MHAVVIYESMFGNTHTVADNIAVGLRAACDVVDVVPTSAAIASALDAADLVVVGGPTHAHGMSSEASRSSAHDMADKDDELDLDPDAEGPGLRDWFKELEGRGRRAAAFDTRFHASALLTGRASKGIARRLRQHGFDVVVEPESFLVDTDNHLVDGEAGRAEAWGRAIVEQVRQAAPR